MSLDWIVFFAETRTERPTHTHHNIARLFQFFRSEINKDVAKDVGMEI